MHTLFFDGCSKGNPGPAGCGAVIYDNENKVRTVELIIYKYLYFLIIIYNILLLKTT